MGFDTHDYEMKLSVKKGGVRSADNPGPGGRKGPAGEGVKSGPTH
jgi:hypothetical protein